MWEVYNEEASCSCHSPYPSVVVATEDDAKKVVEFLGGTSYYNEMYVPEPVDVDEWLKERQAEREYSAAYAKYSDEYRQMYPAPTVKEWAKSASIDDEPVRMTKWFNDEERFPDSDDNDSHYYELDYLEDQAYQKVLDTYNIGRRAYALQQLAERRL